jgi:hypothetical protein
MLDGKSTGYMEGSGIVRYLRCQRHYGYVALKVGLCMYTSSKSDCRNVRHLEGRSVNYGG